MGAPPTRHPSARGGNLLKAQLRQGDAPGEPFLLPTCLVPKVQTVYGKEGLARDLEVWEDPKCPSDSQKRAGENVKPKEMFRYFSKPESELGEEEGGCERMELDFP